MDFAVCPSCGQSVLDDDAEDCPFCGVSMKAKPGAKPAGGAKPAAPAKPPATAATKPGAKPAGKPQPKPAADDFPFDADMMQPSDAIAASAAAGKGRTLQVVCPMCETPGFVPTSAAGKMVKCANPKCMVPLFKAPAPEAPKAAAPPPPPPKNNIVTLGIITAVVVGALGLGAYVFVTMSGGSKPVVKQLTPDEIERLKVKPVTPATGTKTAASDPDGTPDATPVTPTGTADTAKLTAEMLKAMSEMALLTGGQNRSKPLCRRLAAEAFAISGQIKAAREQIGNLGVVGKDVPFYRVVPWVEVAWAELAAKHAAEAKSALDQAVTESASLPKFGRDRLITATYLAAGLAGAGRFDEARAALKDRESGDADGELAFALCWLAFDRKQTEIEPLYKLTPIVERVATQTAATTAVLVLRSQSAEAIAFAKSITNAEQKRDALAGWIEAQVWTSPTEAPQKIEPELAALTPVDRAYLWARAARVAVSRQGNDAAKTCLEKAVAAIEAVPVPAEFAFPALKALMKWKLASTAELVAAATAAGEVALAQHAVGEAAAAEASLNRMLAITRAIGPALALPAAKQKEIDGLGLNAMREKLKKDLELRNDDDVRQALGVYRNVVGHLSTIAQTRFDFQARALSRAAALGMEKPVWAIVSQRTAVEDLAQQEPYFNSLLPSWLMYRFEVTQATDDAAALAAAYSQVSNGKIVAPTASVLNDHFNAGRSKEALALLSTRGFKGEAREVAVIRGAIALMHQNAVEAGWEMIAKQQEAVLREQAYQWASLVLARQGKGAAAWKHAETFNGVTEKESVARGVIAGLRDRQMP